MKKFSMLFLAAAIALVGAIVAPNKAEAVPAFARQVGVGCYSCHYQHFPKLNAFGREFKLGGYTQSAQDLIQDEHLSLPPVLNASMLFKYRYQQTTSKPVNQNAAGDKIGADRGQLQIYDEASILAGGRVGENMGAMVEFAEKGAMSSKFIYSKNFGGVQGGLAVFQTDALGAAYGMELFNTGAVRNIRGIEDRKAAYIQQAMSLGTSAGAATGIYAFGGNDLFVFTVGLWGPATGNAMDTGFNLSTYYRIAVTPKVADGLELMVGLQGMSGETKLSSTDDGTTSINGSSAAATAAMAITAVKTEANTIDFQVQTNVGGMSLEVTGAYADAGKNNAAGSADASGMAFQAGLGIVKGAGLKAAFGTGKGKAAGSKDTSMLVLGGWYALAQNVELSLDYATWSGDGRDKDNRMTLMLEFAF